MTNHFNIGDKVVRKSDPRKSGVIVGFASDEIGKPYVGAYYDDGEKMRFDNFENLERMSQDEQRISDQIDGGIQKLDEIYAGMSRCERRELSQEDARYAYSLLYGITAMNNCGRIPVDLVGRAKEFIDRIENAGPPVTS